ncbi:hypothetical protein AB0K40_17800 [Nonomuraea bangladeshensis]|uniref:Uncharacterized protein n=1 Tax=Nonomuraea bangladeshensis TaxID=404385 RepID=A0ABV3H4A3_9ACTN
MAKPTLPVTLHLGDITTADLGTVTVPFTTTGTATKDSAGQWFVEVKVDQAALQQAIADVLRTAADKLERGLTHGD